MGVVFGTFIINLFSSALGDDKFQYFTPFRYFDNTYILENGHYDPLFLGLTGFIILVSLGMAFYRYHKKDMSQI